MGKLCSQGVISSKCCPISHSPRFKLVGLHANMAAQIHRINGNRAGQYAYSVIGNLHICFSNMEKTKVYF